MVSFYTKKADANDPKCVRKSEVSVRVGNMLGEWVQQLKKHKIEGSYISPTISHNYLERVMDKTQGNGKELQYMVTESIESITLGLQTYI